MWEEKEVEWYLQLMVMGKTWCEVKMESGKDLSYDVYSEVVRRLEECGAKTKHKRES
jgi:hypothetical protein